ncbi:hypothetical protein ACS0TY_022497 [Phlomoides rotata]
MDSGFFSLLYHFLRLKTITAAPLTSTIESLELKFGRKGIKFLESGEIELTVRNGSSLKLQIPNGHITSYKPKVYWKDDGYEEVLHTLDGPPHSRGGIALVINDDVNDEWTVEDVDSDSIDALQVELRCSRGSLEMKYVVSLYPLSMATAVIVKNNGGKAVSLSSAILTHFRFTSRGGTGVQGLKGCSYSTHPPPYSPFQIMSPSEAIKPQDPGLFSFGWEPEKKPGLWSVQDVPITVLKHKVSRVYAAPPQERSKAYHRSPPSKYEIIDQGRELFFRLIRMGFQEIHLSSPGSSYDNKDYFICTGPASMLVPLTLNPGQEWKGAQVIEHDNL